VPSTDGGMPGRSLFVFVPEIDLPVPLTGPGYYGQQNHHADENWEHAGEPQRSPPRHRIRPMLAQGEQQVNER